MPPSKLEEVSARLAELFGTGPARDIEKNFRALMSSALARLDLVTREEFDVQAKVLARTQEKLAALEARLEKLEQRFRDLG
ncbi:MAG: accessory factor UbiK family protein [Burkholderiales bacterium]